MPHGDAVPPQGDEAMDPMNEHIVKSYEDELNALGAACARLGGLAEAQLGDAVDAVLRRDPALAARGRSRDGSSTTRRPTAMPCGCGSRSAGSS